MMDSRTIVAITAFLCCVLCCVSAQIRITPPPPGRDPVEANGRLYNLNYVPSQCKDPKIIALPTFGGLGQTIKEPRVFMPKYGPFLITGNIEVAPSGCLVIMPGTEMFFNPGLGIIVNGTLIARVSIYDQIMNPQASCIQYR